MGAVPQRDAAVPAADHDVPAHRADHRRLLRVHQHLRHVSSAATGMIGGPLNSTDVVLTYTYKQAFAEIDLGYGAALSFLLAAVIGAVSLVELRFARRQGLS